MPLQWSITTALITWSIASIAYPDGAVKPTVGKRGIKRGIGGRKVDVTSLWSLHFVGLSVLCGEQSIRSGYLNLSLMRRLILVFRGHFNISFFVKLAISLVFETSKATISKFWPVERSSCAFPYLRTIKLWLPNVSSWEETDKAPTLLMNNSLKCLKTC